MKNLKLLLLLSFTSLIISCDNKPKKTPIQKLEKTEIKKAEIIEKRWDSLNQNNVEDFFTEYAKNNKETMVRIKTKFGDIKIKLYNDTPIHRANFVFLTKINYFDTTVFYRIAKDFVIQGGNSDNLETSKQRYEYGNYLLPQEFRSNRKHKYGAVAAARDYDNNPDKDSSPFEFYIIQSKRGGHHLNNEHTVFGEVISGFSTIDKIAQLETGPDEWPKEDVYMKVEIIN
ncbi:peptidylprolyl isomerase [Urechidicola croceus]|uniref:Peptidyl-prolyl cis-trans isomerase n=1 Tax=Urechidicola croceus TaxID=1850246 RepID=A0A1D8P5S4_9FLAO|nr:peptidylprolyl isomerase [Urechidicola croceus]AOW19929.1 peptidylprolyl isomerase [Urechidicola croceus]